MRLSSLLVTAATVILVRGADNTTVTGNTTIAGNATTIIGNTTISLNSTEIQFLANLTANLTAEDYYGAAIPPWHHHCTPGWYYGDYPEDLPGNLTVPWLKDDMLCWYLDICKSGYWCPSPKPPPATGNGYTDVFSNYTGAVEGSDYLTYGLVDTVQDCKDMCNSVDGCVYINCKWLSVRMSPMPNFLYTAYHDVNGKGGSPLLTCSLFSKCHTIADATNVGGQTQSDGSINYITDSEGYCKE
ncbi:hypothetical protein DFS33DRAFT_615492 [Desarmillaria ectypa]|nr:hypothetical protein DFS33DRAFT_615492 [Desarmillaria ectypa]